MGPFGDGWTREDVGAVMAESDPRTLLYVPIVVSMDPPDAKWAQAICVELAAHEHPNVRGNAILGFGHLVRTTGQLDRSVVLPLVVRALSDEDQYVRGRADAAVEDLEHYLGWAVPSASQA